MSSDTSLGQPSQRPTGQPSEWQRRIKNLRMMFQGLGAVVSVLVAVLGVAIFLDNEHVDDFWKICHWISQGSLCIIIGLSGCFLEVRALFPSVKKQFRRFAINRLGLAMVYIWVGFFSMGGRAMETNEAWGVLGKVTGILAWVVGIVDIVMSCCWDRSVAPEDSHPQQTPAVQDHAARTRCQEAEEAPEGNPFGDDDPASTEASKTHYCTKSFPTVVVAG